MLRSGRSAVSAVIPRRPHTMSFNQKSIAIRPGEAGAELMVYADTVLALTVAF